MKEIFNFSPKHKTNLAKTYFTIDSKKDHNQGLFKVKCEFQDNFLNLIPEYILGPLIISSQILYIIVCFSFLL